MLGRRLLVALSVALLGALTTAPAALAAAPTNDVWTGRTVVNSLPFSETIDTSEATTDADDAEANANCGAPATDASVWYEFTPSTDQAVIVDVSGSDYSAGVLVVSGTPGTFQLEACGPVAIAFEAAANVSYSILAIDDQGDGGGNGGSLSISMDAAPPPPSLDLTVNPVGSFNRDGSAIIRGSITCTGQADFIEIDVFLSQLVGRRTINGSGFEFFFDCDGTERPWSVTVFGENGLFRGGKAASVTVGFACGFFCTDVVVEQTVMLRK